MLCGIQIKVSILIWLHCISAWENFITAFLSIYMLPRCITQGGGGTVHFACGFYDGRSVHTAETYSFAFRVVTLWQNFAEVVGAILSLFKASLIQFVTFYVIVNDIPYTTTKSKLKKE